MDYGFPLLLIAHLLGLILVAAAFLPLLGMMGQGGAAPQTSRYLTRLGHYGFIILIISGPLMLWVHYNGGSGLSHWFWAKMGMVALLAAGVVLSAMSARKMRAGDQAAAARVRLGRIIAVAAIVASIVFAVLAFR